jgi:hypothetical protein
VGVISIVDSLVAEFGGGQDYFTALDKRILELNGWPVRALVDMARVLWDYDVKFVVSGAVGKHWANWTPEDTVWAPGGLRYGAPVQFWKISTATGTLLRKLDLAELPARMVLLDDSFYRGRTLDALNAASHGRVIGAVTVYDGSSGKARPNVFSLYRWHDRHSSPGALRPAESVVRSDLGAKE